MSPQKDPPSLLSVVRLAANEINSNSKLDSNFKYVPPASVKENLIASDTLKNTKIAQSYGGGSNLTTPPSFYSPFLTTQAFQIPNNRKEVSLWASMFYDKDPKVAAGINFYTDFIFSGYSLECQTSYVKTYFEKLCKKLKLHELLPQISFEYHLRGDCFCFSTVDCKKCENQNIDVETGEICDHTGATWASIDVMNSMQIEISSGFLNKTPKYYYTFTDEERKAVMDGTAPEMPEYLIQAILSSGNIELDSRQIKHFKRGSSPWTPYGTSLVRSLFQTLAYKDKLTQAQYIIADRYILPVRLVKVGTAERPANEADIQAVQDQLAARANDPLLTMVTHDAVTYEYIGAQGGILQVAGEHDAIENDLLDGLMVSKDLLSGLGGPQTQNNVSLIAMDRRLEKFRLQVAEWLEEFIFKPEAERNGFITDGRDGEREIVYPKIKWKDLELRDQSNKMQILQSLQSSGVLSAETLLEILDINYDQEVERLRFESSSQVMTPAIPAPLGSSPEMPGQESLGTGFQSIMPVSKNKTENYTFASNLTHELSKQRMAYASDFPKKFVSKAHEKFVLSQKPITGRGNVGALDRKFNGSNISIIPPVDGGIFCEPQNIYAFEQYAKIANNENVIKQKMVYAEKIKEAKNNDSKAPVKLFTKIEQALYNIIFKINIPLAFYAQFEAGPDSKYRLDAAFPTIKLGIEADSETYHSTPDAIAKDKYRDQELMSEGWIILRFTDSQLQDRPDEVGQVIIQTVKYLLNHYSGGNVSSNTI